MRWDLLASGAALAGYGWFFKADLGWAAYGVIGLGIVIPTLGKGLYRWAEGLAERIDGAWSAPQILPPELALAKAWRHFWVSLIGMLALAAFSLWRVQTTVWLPVSERFYIFPAHTWLGRLEHSWFNDFLYAFGMVGILYALYTVKEFVGSRHESSVGSVLDAGPSQLTQEQWTDHQDRSKLMIGTGIVIILAWAWLEEIGDLVPGYIFDKWDVNAIYLGFILGYTMMHRLSYPVFSARPPFFLNSASRPDWLDDAIRILYVAFVWTYTYLMNPSEYAERWSHIAELSALVLGSMWLLDVRRRPKQEPVALDLAPQQSKS